MKRSAITKLKRSFLLAIGIMLSGIFISFEYESKSKLEIVRNIAKLSLRRGSIDLRKHLADSLRRFFLSLSSMHALLGTFCLTEESLWWRSFVSKACSRISFVSNSSRVCKQGQDIFHMTCVSSDELTESTSKNPYRDFWVLRLRNIKRKISTLENMRKRQNKSIKTILPLMLHENSE